MSTALIIVLAVVGLFALLAVGGFLGSRRRAVANEPHFRAELERANRDLAAAHAADRGWAPERLHAAARTAYAEQQGGGAITELELVQVVDPPGTEADKAVFRVATDGGQVMLTLGRSGDDWHFESLS